jgi:hypothetical protein
MTGRSAAERRAACAIRHAGGRVDQGLLATGRPASRTRCVGYDAKRPVMPTGQRREPGCRRRPTS